MFAAPGLFLACAVVCAAHPYRDSNSSHSFPSQQYGLPTWTRDHPRPGAPSKGSWRPPPSIQPTWGVRPATADRIASGSLPANPTKGNVGIRHMHKENAVPTTSGCQEGSKFHKVGDKWTPEGGCGRSICNEGGKTTLLGCPTIESADKCTIVPQDARQPWPLCCSQLICSQ